MGRFETLNADTKDLVEALLPALAKSFGVADPVDLIPEDIRMRAWDCERRDHIKDQTENEPRNWGVQFLKDLMAISRLKSGDLVAFHKDLRAKVVLHEEKHPWCRLSDIRELKDEYTHPDRPKVVEPESAGTSSTDSYLEELHEPNLPPGMKRGRMSNHEIYEARVQPSHKRRKYGSHGRLRRSEVGGFIRKEKSKGGKNRDSTERFSATPSGSHRPAKRPSRVVSSDDEDFHDSYQGMTMASQSHPTPSFSRSPASGPIQAPFSAIVSSTNSSTEPLHVQKLQAELEVAESELKVGRIRLAYLAAKKKAEDEAKQGAGGTQDAPHELN